MEGFPDTLDTPQNTPLPTLSYDYFRPFVDRFKNVRFFLSFTSVRVGVDVDPDHRTTVWLTISIVRYGILPSRRCQDSSGVVAQSHNPEENQFCHVCTTISAEKIRIGRYRRRRSFVSGFHIFKVEINIFEPFKIFNFLHTSINLTKRRDGWLY